MNTNPDSLLREALKLSDKERAALADELLESLGMPEPELDAQWLEEARDRMAAYRRGEIDAIDAEEVFTELGKGN